MILRLMFIAISLSAVPTFSKASLTDVTCDDRSRLETTLKDVMGATRQGSGLRDPETLLEVWVSSNSGDWPIVQNYSNGTACIVAMGEHWQGSLAAPA